MVHFKYYNGNTAATSETIPASCAMGGKRMISAVTTATILDTVCFNSCSNICQPASTSTQVKEDPSLSPNPMLTSALLSFHDQSAVHHVNMFDMYGRIIRTYSNLKSNSLYINKENLQEGIYQLQIIQENNKATFLKLVIQ